MFHMKSRTICVRGHTLLRGTSLTFTGTFHRGQDLSLDQPRTSQTKTFTKWSGEELPLKRQLMNDNETPGTYTQSLNMSIYFSWRKTGSQCKTHFSNPFCLLNK